MIKNKRKYILFYLKTGAGHFAPAVSLANYLMQHHSQDVSPVLVDGFENTNRLVKNLIEEGYRHLQSKAKWLYAALYAFNKITPFARVSCYVVSKSSVKFIKKRILEENPEKIVILHFFLIEPVYEAIKKLNLNIPVYTLVTDPYTAHPVWFLRKDQQYIVFSEKLKQNLPDRVSRESVRVFPFIIEEKFSRPVPASAVPQLKYEMGFTADRKLILILGGGDGIPHGKAILEKILSQKPEAEIAVVCGKNKSFYIAANKLKERYPGISVKVYEFVSFIYELLNISDVIVTKCGASTITEILVTNKVPVINNYLWEQEKGNIEFVQENGLGIYERNISRIPEVVKKLIEDDEYYERFNSNIRRLNIKNGVSDVAEFLFRT